jgi:hypothetical protein
MAFFYPDIRISHYFWLEWDLGPETAGFGMAMLNCVNWHTFPAFAHRCTSNAASSHEFFFFFFFFTIFTIWSDFDCTSRRKMNCQ